ncbi:MULTISPECIES: phage holin family protein [Pseudoalteromonas]|uniref:phage holin family protein n=1 Tax=Pseudoalteromonas TaxID=53246 RepID=UPI00110A937B|nr:MULTISPECIES: phage holin family protein [Pseudoalteromonas]MCG7545423.1 hypothetical protein [Pseudoalteromonas sp. MM17-2]TMO87692.1 hypothetical protein CWC12_10465 [Pseudoalteromonas ruthenica]TMP21497.1 hypothetical protein CWC06_18290 [Pseudoalteromonas ruthenica]
MHGFDPMLLLLVVGVSMLSGAGTFLHQRRKQRQKRSGWLVELLSELVMAQTAGLAALFLGWWQELPTPLTCLIAMIAASNGASFMDLGRKVLAKRIDNGGYDG